MRRRTECRARPPTRAASPRPSLRHSGARSPTTTLSPITPRWAVPRIRTWSSWSEIHGPEHVAVALVGEQPQRLVERHPTQLIRLVVRHERAVVVDSHEPVANDLRPATHVVARGW